MRMKNFSVEFIISSIVKFSFISTAISIQSPQHYPWPYSRPYPQHRPQHCSRHFPRHFPRHYSRHFPRHYSRHYSQQYPQHRSQQYSQQPHQFLSQQQPHHFSQIIHQNPFLQHTGYQNSDFQSHPLNHSLLAGDKNWPIQSNIFYENMSNENYYDFENDNRERLFENIKEMKLPAKLAYNDHNNIYHIIKSQIDEYIKNKKIFLHEFELKQKICQNLSEPYRIGESDALHMISLYYLCFHKKFIKDRLIFLKKNNLDIFLRILNGLQLESHILSNYLLNVIKQRCFLFQSNNIKDITGLLLMFLEAVHQMNKNVNPAQFEISVINPKIDCLKSEPNEKIEQLDDSISKYDLPNISEKCKNFTKIQADVVLGATIDFFFKILEFVPKNANLLNFDYLWSKIICLIAIVPEEAFENKNAMIRIMLYLANKANVRIIYKPILWECLKILIGYYSGKFCENDLLLFEMIINQMDPVQGERKLHSSNFIENLYKSINNLIKWINKNIELNNENINYFNSLKGICVKTKDRWENITSQKNLKK